MRRVVAVQGGPVTVHALFGLVLDARDQLLAGDVAAAQETLDAAVWHARTLCQKEPPRKRDKSQ
ncbi:MAG: hypothetical protein ACOYOQ_00575 [Microthrixaceae bacterium]